MIIRVLGEGQYRVPDDSVAAINALDGEIQAALEEFEAKFQALTDTLVAAVRSQGTALPVEEFVPSDAIVPGVGTTLTEALGMLGDEGLIPG